MVEVVVETSNLARGRMGSITGPVFLRFEGGAYPGEGWNDFPVVILGWWLEGIARLITGESESFSGRFMDGPYEFTVRRLTTQKAEISWRSSHAPPRTIDVPVLLQSMAAAGASVVLTCRTNGWQSADVETLERAVARVAT
jgi:hypothetical protein